MPLARTTTPTGQSPRKIGLLGGTFNPIHRCHLTLAHDVRQRLNLDQILFIPTGDPPHKHAVDLAPAEDRLAMVTLALEGEPGLAVSDLEIRRPGISYSIDTVTLLQQEWGASAELYFLVGLDAFLDLSTWRRAGDLLSSCHFVVVSRAGASFTELSRVELLPPLDNVALRDLESSRTDSLVFELPAARRLFLLAIPPCLVSATLIRERIRLGAGLDGLLPAQVESYILRKGLYRENHHLAGFKS
ncbi:putative nicotinate-nucleotide adenylyltransferase [Nitrospira tepida]|uniref:Probable nicotinate-nucleotide adenylyltransferase n=1 Tax=Nitrospira tepida TaxID=2973512 RepID=A0AA86MXN5_9BACT|nr:nicotinate-nucleotide adenylyltransferase [Nitrospira tepida]CAI4030941.1 putative nicotinate-nucleotide adenylyltransferase [Nitrospira tepida]